MVRKDLGMVTAYAYAVSKGYTGTEEEFAELMASYATVAESAEASAQAAAGSASSAAGSATNASGSASAAAGSASAAASSASTASTKAGDAASSATAAAESAGTASTKAGEAASSASAAAQSATQAAGSASAAAQSATDANTAKTDAQTAKTAAETAQEKAEEAQAAAEAAAQTLVIDDTLTQANQAAEAKAVGDALETKAEMDGYYQDMTVGDAEQLVSSQYVEDNVPYKFRMSGGSADVGNREYVDKIVGGTIAWNQLVATDITRTYNGITFTPTDDGYVLNGTASGKAYIVLFATGSFISGHRYLMFDDGNLSDYGFWINTEPQRATHAHFVTGGNLTLTVKDGATVTNLTLHPQIFDLTQMFGSTVADAVYAMEQATAGAGVAWFRGMFPNNYYPYNAGELISVSGLQSHDTVGFNLWDEEWVNGFFNDSGVFTARNDIVGAKNAIPVIPNSTYYCKLPSTSFVTFWRAKVTTASAPTSEFIARQQITGDGGIITIPADCHYIFFNLPSSYGATYKNDICINLSWSGTRNGEYQPYEKHSYPLDSTLTLRGIPKLSADNQLYFDGDEYLPEGKVNRRFGIVDLGTLDWTYVTSGNNPYYTAQIPGTYKREATTGIRPSWVCSKYSIIPQASWTSYENGLAQLQTDTNAKSILVKDPSYTSAESFKTAMSGVMLVYELATPTEETADPYSGIQLVNDWGTEEYVSGTICPVGHETRYPANLRDKLQHLPDAASGNGSYLITQTDGQMVLTPFPAPPSTAGNYVLKATVTGGVATYTWEVVT